MRLLDWLRRKVTEPPVRRPDPAEAVRVKDQRILADYKLRTRLDRYGKWHR